MKKSFIGKLTRSNSTVDAPTLENNKRDRASLTSAAINIDNTNLALLGVLSIKTYSAETIIPVEPGAVSN